MDDPTESTRRQLVADLNGQQNDRAMLEKEHGQVYSTTELQAAFTVESFLSPFVLVTRKIDGKRGSLMFSHSPRFYFKFELA